MKKIYSLLVMMLLGIAAATAATSTLTFEAACGGSGTADDGTLWTVTSDGTESAYDSTKGIHYGTGKAAVQYIKLSTSDITGTITEVKVNASTASGVSATASVTVGGAAFGGDPQSISTSATDYTFTGSASGEIVVTVTKPESANKAIYVKSVAVTYQEGGEPAQTYAITYNEMENGSVTGPAEAAEGATVTLTVTPDSGYQLASLTVEDENDEAISVSNNKFTMPAGPVYVSATFEEIPTLQSIAEFIGSTGTQTFGIPVVALGQNGSNLYIVDENNTAGLLVYGTIDQTYSFGDVIPAGFSGTYSLFRSQHELASPAGFAASTAQATLTPMEASISDISHVNFGRYAVLRGATISGTTITVGSETVTLYNRFEVTAPTDGGTYDIYGVISIYNEGAQFLPIRYEAVDVPEPTKYAIEIDAQIVNGTVEADKTEAAEGETVTLTVTPATGYELESITVLDANLEEVTVSNNAFTMPASNVLVSATFVEQGEQPQPTTGDWVKTDASALKTGDVVVFVELTKLSALPNDGGASAPVFTAITLADNDTKLAAAPADNLKWTVTVTNGSYQFQNADGDYLYCNNANNGVRVGSSADNAFTIDAGYLKNTAHGRYLGVYNTQDWRCYTSSTANNIKDQEFAFFKQASDEPVSEEFYLTATLAEGTYEGPQVVYIEAHNGEIEEALYTVNEGETQTYNAETGIAINAAGENSIYVYATDTEGNEAELNLTYTITYPDVEIAVSPEAGTYYEAQNVHVTVAGTYGEDVLISYKFAEEDQYIEYDDEAGIDITESCTLYVNVVTDYQDTEASFEYVITEAPELLTENATIVFTSGSNDGSAFTGDNAAIDEGADLIASITNYDKFYTNGANGAKFGTGSVAGKATINLVNGYAATKVVVKAMAYGTDSGVTFKLNGTESETIATDELADYEFTLDGTGIYSLAFEASKSSKCRFWVKSIDIICSEQPEGISLAEALAGGEGLISNDLTVVKVYGGKAYLTDGEDNWVSIEGGNADQLTPGAVIDGYQLSGIANAATNPAITISEDVTFTQGENIPTIDELDLRGGIAEMPKAGKVVSIIGWYLQEDGQNVFSAYSGKNGSKGNTIPLADAGSMTVGSEYTIEAAITLTEAWDAEQSAGAPRRVSPTGDDALKNITLSLVGDPVATAVNDIAVDADVVSVKYVNVAGQVSAQPFDGINVVVTTYVDGTTKAVKVVK